MSNHGPIVLVFIFTLHHASLGQIASSTAAANCDFGVTVTYPEGRGLPDVSCDDSSCSDGSLNSGKLYKKIASLTELGMMVEVSYSSDGNVGCQLVPDVPADILSDAYIGCNPGTTTTSTTTTTTTTTTPEPTTTTTPITTPEPTTTTTSTTTTTPEPTTTTTSTTTTTTEPHPQPTCPSNSWKLNLDLGYCYMFNKDSKTWDDAEASCARNGAHLASIHSWQERYYIQQNLPGESWFGLNDQSRANSYVYSDGSSYDYSQWVYQEPNNSRRGWIWWSYEYENCIEIQTSGYWNDAFCDEKKTYVCKTAIVYK